MNPDKTNIILGPPGTGKTTKLLSIIDTCLEAGRSPAEICFLTFTKKAAAEASNRAQQKFNLTAQELPYFKTIHSLAFTQLQMQRSQVMGFGNYLDIARILGISISGRGLSEDGTFAGFEKGDRLLFTENLARVMRIPLRTLWEASPNEDLDILELEQLRDTLLEYKRINLKLDFTDMLHQYIESKPGPKCPVLVVDEAQDLSKIQWELISALSEAAEEIYIAGDDDQAIFRWAGADVDTLISLPGKVTVLDQSYRVPGVVAKLAAEVIGRCGVRREKVWKPREEVGEVNYMMGLEQINMDLGNWLLLGRNAYFLKMYEEHCERNGYLYDSPTGSALRGPSWTAVRLWERLRAGKELNISDVLKVYEFMSIKERVQYGFKGKIQKMEKTNPKMMMTLDLLKREWGLRTEAIWHEALDRLSEADRTYFLSALRRGEKVGRDPRIKISTIHGAKGGEADNVVVFTDMAMRTHQEYQENPDDEARVWYVAITRAKQNLFIIQPQTMRNYDL